MTYLSADPLPSTGALRRIRCTSTATQWPGLPPGTVFLESGRVALWGALRALRLGTGDRLVVPAYICDSILPAPAALGVEIQYLATDRQLRPDLAALERELAAGARAVLVVHYFGLPAPELEAMLKLCAGYGASVIEDCAHALFSQVGDRPLGSFGAATIFSPRKSLPLPDGGALVLHGAEAPADLAELPRPGVETARRLAYRGIGVVETAFGWSPRLWLLRSWGLRRRMQARVAVAPLVPRRSSALAEALLRGTDWRSVVARRRSNYLRLATALREVGWARPLFPELPAGACPFGFPILVEDREGARRRLLAAGVNVRAYWEQLPAAVSVERFAEAQAVADRILVLPVHQSLSVDQMNHLLRVLRSLETS
jgi:dTDP-4-amino-4,6-dideoxygalactose transaminase